MTRLERQERSAPMVRLSAQEQRPNTVISKAAILVMLGVILLVFQLALSDLKAEEITTSRDYFVENALTDTGARNVVAAILLDYRLFDSIFEAATLLIASAGVLYLVRK